MLGIQLPNAEQIISTVRDRRAVSSGAVDQQHIGRDRQDLPVDETNPERSAAKWRATTNSIVITGRNQRPVATQRIDTEDGSARGTQIGYVNSPVSRIDRDAQRLGKGRTCAPCIRG